MKKLLVLIETEKCDVETDEITKFKAFPENKTITLIKKLEHCKPFIGVSVLFLCITIILVGILTYFCLKLKK